MIQVPDIYEDSRVLRYEVAVDGVICFTLAIIDIYIARGLRFTSGTVMRHDTRYWPPSHHLLDDLNDIR